MPRWLRALLFNRNTIALFVLAAAAAGCNAYVAMHDDGVLTGQVQSADGRPAAGVTVTLYKRELIGLEKVAQATTGGDGAFRFERHHQHRPILVLETTQGRKSKEIEVRLLFRNQNRVLDEPLRAP